MGFVVEPNEGAPELVDFAIYGWRTMARRLLYVIFSGGARTLLRAWKRLAGTLRVIALLPRGVARSHLLPLLEGPALPRRSGLEEYGAPYVSSEKGLLPTCRSSRIMSIEDYRSERALWKTHVKLMCERVL